MSYSCLKISKDRSVSKQYAFLDKISSYMLNDYENMETSNSKQKLINPKQYFSMRNIIKHMSTFIFVMLILLPLSISIRIYVDGFSWMSTCTDGYRIVGWDHSDIMMMLLLMMIVRCERNVIWEIHREMRQHFQLSFMVSLLPICGLWVTIIYFTWICMHKILERSNKFI